MSSSISQILTSAYGSEITEKLLNSYREIEENYILGKWKPSELDSGHFVESARRILEFELLGSYTPYEQSQSRFTDQVLMQYQNSSGDESFRMLIPRILKSIYNIRNKRGVGHIGPVSPNSMDASYILHSVKWVLGEIVRLKSGLDTDETQKLIDSISQRNIDILWNTSETKRVLNPKISAKDQVLILLFGDSPQPIDQLRNSIEYKNSQNFKKLVIGKLHSERFLEYNETTGNCEISPSGTLFGEQLIIKYANLLNN